MRLPCAMRWCGVSVLALAALGCGKTGSKPATANEPMGNAGDGGGSEVPSPGIDPEACTGPQLGPSPLRHLDAFQLENTLRDLFQAAPAVAQAVQGEWRKVSPGLADPVRELGSVDDYHRIVHTAALVASSDESLVALTGCDPQGGAEVGCRNQFLESWLWRSYRRPPTDEDLTEMQQVFALGQELQGDFAGGVRAVVEVVLQGPDFLYLIEQGEGDVEDGVVPLGSYETAARLAYFLTGTLPDQELISAAQAGAFTEADVEAHARRLLGGPGSRLVTRDFFEKLFRFENLANPLVSKPAPYTAVIAQLTREETGSFVEHVTFDGAGTLQALLTEPATWVNGPLAAFYGIAGVSGDDFQRVELDPAQRAGVLTQSAFLSSTSPISFTNPVVRGATVLRTVLCVDIPPPPPDVEFMPPPDLPETATMRQRIEVMTQDPVCQGCHVDIDPVGFAFEHYDSVGLWRTSENGSPIDASGVLYKTDAQGPFADAIKLVQRIALSDDARACLAGNWLSYAHGRPAGPEDACARTELETALAESDGNLVELLVALAKTDQFRYRLASELAR